MPLSINEILQKLESVKTRFLSDVALLSEIYAPSGEEEGRIQFVVDRFTQSGVPQVRIDEFGNAIGFIKGTEKKDKSIVITSHVDSAVPKEISLTTSIESNKVVGPGVSGTPLSASVLTCLPEALDLLGIKLKSDISLVASVNSIGVNNEKLSGLDGFLSNVKQKTDAGIVLRGLSFGELNCYSIGSLRGNIHVESTEADTKDTYSTNNAIVIITSVINRLLRIAIPRRPYSDLILGRLRSGYSHDIEPDQANLGFEIVSYDEKILSRIKNEVQDIAEEMASRHMASVNVEIFRSRRAGGISYSHPLVKSAKKILEDLGEKPKQGHSSSELSDFIKHKIPTVTLGISKGSRNLKTNDFAKIDPMMKSMAQLISLLVEIDNGETYAY